MDIEKLEKLSCLKLSAEDKREIAASIEGIWVLMEDLQGVSLADIKEIEKLPTVFTKREDIMFRIEEKTSGIKAVEGKFEAPRVVRKK